MLHLEKIKNKNREAFLPLLLMADESEEIVRNYLGEGALFAVKTEKSDTIGCILLTDVSQKIVEIKNIALIPEYRGKGYGKKCINYIFRWAKERKKEKVIVGTANSSIDNILFYQKCGFRFFEIKKNFFAQYPDPVIENGIIAMDMVYFEYIV